MARLGVTYQDIANAADQLVGQGKQPTIEMIRHLLGTGSSTTIANHLRKWRAGQDGALSVAIQENLPQELVSLLKGLWQRVLHQADIKIVGMQEKSDAIVASLQQGIEKYKNNNQRWQKLHDQWVKEKEQLSVDKLSLQQAVDALQKENMVQVAKQETLSHQLQDKEERIAELHRLYQQIQANLEHYRESSREQRVLDQQQFEQQKQALQSEINSLKQHLLGMTEKNSALKLNHHSLHEMNQALEKTHHQLITQFEKNKHQLMGSEKLNIELDQTSRHWQEQCKQLQKMLEDKTNQLIHIQTETGILSKQLSDAKQSLNEVIDQNKLIGHEKWVLAQEKSQLEGQLKQMQKIISA